MKRNTHTIVPKSTFTVTGEDSLVDYQVIDTLRFNTIVSCDRLYMLASGSICRVKRNTRVLIEKSQFTLIKGEECLVNYQVTSSGALNLLAW